VEPRKKPILLEFEVVHPCYAVDSTAKIKDSRMRWITTAGKDAGGIYNVYQVRSPHIDRFIEALRKHPLVQDVNVLRKTGDLAELGIKSDYNKMVIATINKTKCVLLDTSTESGVDRALLLAPSEKNFREFMDSLKDTMDIRLKAKRYLRQVDQIGLDTFRSSGFLQLKEVSERLTGKEMECFSLACKQGYYETPKKVTLEELAGMAGVSKATFAEHLNKAESKMLPILAELMKTLK